MFQSRTFVLEALFNSDFRLCSGQSTILNPEEPLKSTMDMSNSLQRQLTTQPLVSVVMSVFNGERYVRDAIESILNQTYKNWEFIIINDGSKDSTESIICQYKDERIKYYFHENIGLTRSLNRGIIEARGKYIARLDADDRSLPERLEKQVAFLEENQSFLLVGTYSYNVDLSTMEISMHRPPATDEACRKRLKSGSAVFMHSSVMFRKNVGDKLVMYNEQFVEAQDYRLWVTLATKGKLATLEEPLCLTLRNDGSSITSKRTHLKQFMLSLKLSWISYRNLDFDIITFLQTLMKNIALLFKVYFLERQTIHIGYSKKSSSNTRCISLPEIDSIWRGEIEYIVDFTKI